MNPRAIRLLISFALSSPAGAAESRYRYAVDSERTDEGEALRAGKLESSSASSTYTSPWIEAAIPFNEALISWNVDVPDGAGFAVAMRFEREGETEPSAWYHFGRFGSHPKVERPVTEDSGGRVEIDCFTAKGLYRSHQYRVSLASGKVGAPRIQRVSVLVSNTTGDRALHEKHSRRTKATAAGGSAPLWLDVPFRSQRREEESIAGRICSPTSVSMVLAFRGIDRPTAEVAARAYDSDHDIYGNWPANIQAAYSFGLRGKLARFRTWDDARELIAAGQPIIISIRDPDGVLKNAPYEKTDGHLLVLCGFDEKGNPRVNDPAAKDAARGVTTYDREQMQKVWLDQGGLAYLIEGRGK